MTVLDRKDRFYPELPKPRDTDVRSSFQRDRDRILYSSAFRRLCEITQVVSPGSGYVLHNRLTHSLQVSQVGRRLAEKLTATDPDAQVSVLHPDVVEAACLAHDLGHPPFGHIAEEELNTQASNCGGFEGNAQSFRIITRLAFHSDEYSGLNLTAATLAAVQKYPWIHGDNPAKPQKWGAYLDDKELFNFATSLSGKPPERTIEAQIMDWADDVTYSVHDIEDFFRAGRIPLHMFYVNKREDQRFFEDVFQRRATDPDFANHRSELEQAFLNVIVSYWTIKEPYQGYGKQRAALRGFTGGLIGRYINAVKLNRTEKSWELSIDPGLRREVNMFKELIWTYIIEAPGRATQQFGQRRIVRELLSIFAEAATKSNFNLFPRFYRNKLESDECCTDAHRLRVCVDLVAGMTERQATSIYTRLSGNTPGSGLDDILV